MKTSFQTGTRAYTLIELLTVMAIMSILAGLTAVSISSVKPAALSAGGNQVVAALATARQNSLAKNRATAVVIKTEGREKYSAFCLLELLQPDGSVPQWRFLTAWQNLPNGIRFDPNYTSGATVNDPVNFLKSGVSNLPAGFPATLPFRDSTVDPKSETIVQIYQPDATLLGNGLSCLRLVEANETAIGIQYTHQKPDLTPANYYDVLLLRDSGEPKVVRP